MIDFSHFYYRQKFGQIGQNFVTIDFKIRPNDN